MMKYLIFILTFSLLVVGCAPKTAIYEGAAQKAMQADSYQEGIKYYKANAKKTYRSPVYFLNMARVDESFGAYGEAVNNYTQALKYKFSTDVHLDRGRVYMKMKLYDDAAKDFRTVLDYHGRNRPEVFADLGKAYVAMGELDEAEKYLERALKYNDDTPELLSAVAEMYLGMKEPKKAEIVVKKAKSLGMKTSELSFVNAKVSYALRDAQGAVAELKSAIEQNDKNYEAMKMLAWIYATNPVDENRNGAEALIIAKKLYDVSPDVEYVKVLAAAYAETGDVEKAISVLKEGMNSTNNNIAKGSLRNMIADYRLGVMTRKW